MAHKKQTTDVILYNDYDYNLDDWREGYAEWAEDNEVMVSGDDDSKLYDWIHSQMEMDWEDLMTNIKYSKIANSECVVIGDIGLWYGRRDTIPTRVSDLGEAIKKCCYNVEMIKVTLKTDGHIEVIGVHHDGTNYFEIYLLNKLGCNTDGADLTKECYYKKIKLEDIY